MAWTYGSKFGGGGSVSGTGTAGQVVIWTGSASIGGDTGLTFNVSTNALTASTFIGALTGNADTATNADQLDSHHGSYYQPAAAPLATLAALVDAAGWLHSSGANVFAWSTPTYSEVGALAAGGTAADSDKLDGQHGSYYATAGAAPTAHALVDTTGHTASGLTTGHFLKATAATTYAFGAHGLTYSDVGADAAGAAAAVTPTTLGLVIGTNTQAYSAKLGTFSALADAAGWLHSSGAGVYAWSTPTAGDVGALATAGTAADSDKLDGQHGSYYQTLLTNPVTGTGTTGKLPKFTGASTLGDSVITESGGTVGIGVSPSTHKVEIMGAANTGLKIRSDAGVIGNYAEIVLNTFNSFSGSGQAYIRGVSEASGNSNVALAFGVNTSGFGAPAEVMRITSVGAVGIGTTEPGAKTEIGKAEAAVATTGTASTAFLRLGSTGGNQVADFGLTNVGAAGLWIQATHRNDLSVTYPLMLNPNGGNVGIGVSSPFATLTLPSGSDSKYFGFDRTTGAAGSRRWWIGNDQNSYGDFVIATESTQGRSSPDRPRLVISETGNVGIGTTNPKSTLHVVGGLPQVVIADNATDSTDKYAMVCAAHYTAAQEPMGLIYGRTGTSDNWMYLGGGSSLLNAATSIGLYTATSNTTTTGTLRMWINGSGGIYRENNSDKFDVTSDLRLKKDIRPLAGSLALLARLAPVSFNWKDETKAGEKRGFVAQDVEPILPEWVSTQPDGFKSIRTDGLEAILVSAIQELLARIEVLEART